MQAVVFYAGRADEVGHHAAPIFESIKSGVLNHHAVSGASRHVSARVAEVDEILAEANPGDLVIFYSEHFDRFRNACDQLKQRNVATLYMIDGILEWRNAWENKPDEVACPYTMRPVIAHKVACIGNSQARVIESWGNATKSEVVGIPRLKKLVQRYQGEVRIRAQHNGQSSIASSSGTLKILVMTAKTPAFTEQQWIVVKESLSDLKHWASQNDQVNGRSIEWTWRLTKGLADEIGVENTLDDLSGKELAEVLASVDLVISTPSTSVLEAMLADRPVALLDYHNCPSYVQAAWSIGKSSHIGPTILSMVERDSRRMLFQQNQLYDSLHLESDANDRMLQLIGAMLDVSADCLRENLPLKFSKHLIPPTKNYSAEFSHQRLFPDVESFRENDLATLQAEHSHSRRQIAHLESEIAQLKSELDQAHQIFESINRHPIAGPLVRLRNRISDWMASFRNRNESHEAVDVAPDSNGNKDPDTFQTSALLEESTSGPIESCRSASIHNR